MSDLISLALILLFIGILVKLKINIGLSIFLSTILLALLKLLPFLDVLAYFVSAVKSPDSVRMVLIVISVTYFAELLKKTGFLDRIVSSFRKIFTPRQYIPLFSLVIGLLPMPGGALVSAPLVEEGSKQTGLNGAQKTVLNFWFRHVWEPISPLYPELALSASILGITIFKLISIQWPIFLGMLVSGIIFSLPVIKSNGEHNVVINKDNMLSVFKSVMPILIIIVFMVIFRNLPTYYAIITGIVYIIVIKRLNLKTIYQSANWVNLFTFCFLMISIFFLREVAVKSNLIEGLYSFFTASRVPSLLIIFILPFLIGLITGISSASIGISYPLLLPLMKSSGTISSYYIFVAYLGSWLVLLITPTHLCLSLSLEYFKSKLSDAYKFMAKSIVFLIIVSIAWLIILKLFKY